MTDIDIIKPGEIGRGENLQEGVELIEAVGETIEARYPDKHPKSGKVCRLEERNGRNVYIYPNKHGEDGAIIDVETGKIAGQPKGHKENLFTTDRALAALDVRKDKAVEAAQQGILNGTGAKDVYGGWETVIEAQTRLAQRIDTPSNVSTRAAEFVGNAAGFTGDRRVKLRDSAGNSVEGQLGQVAELVEMVQYFKALRAQKAGE